MDVTSKLIGTPEQARAAMTPTLASIAAQLEQATKGPWVAGSWCGQCHHKHDHSGAPACQYDYTLSQNEYFGRFVSLNDGKTELIGSDDYGPILLQADAAFIAAAPTNIAWLLGEVWRLKGEVERVAQLAERNHCLLEQRVKQAEALAGRLKDCVHGTEIIEWNKSGGCLFCNLKQAEARCVQLEEGRTTVKERR